MNSVVILVILLLYIRFSKRVDDYEKLPPDTDEKCVFLVAIHLGGTIGATIYQTERRLLIWITVFR
jgi:hypothetical protein